MGASEKKCKEPDLRDYVVALIILIIISAFPLYSILIPITRLHLYEELFFYLSVLALISWWGVSYAVYFKIRDKGEMRIARAILVVVVLLGIAGALALDAILRYNMVLSFSYMLLVALWGIIWCIYKIISHIIREHAR
jgi:hypothetical protein